MQVQILPVSLTPSSGTATTQHPKTMLKKKTPSKPRSVVKQETGGGCPEATCSADFDVGGGWGNAINWSGTEQFDKHPLAPESRFNCHGWKWTKPKVGQTLKAEFVRSWMIFEFVEVKPCGDPPDMFFAVVKPIRQISKQNND